MDTSTDVGNTDNDLLQEDDEAGHLETKSRSQYISVNVHESDNHAGLVKCLGNDLKVLGMEMLQANPVY